MPLASGRLIRANQLRIRQVPVGLAGIDFALSRFEYYEKVLETQAANLFGYWPMNELSGTVAQDYSPQANHGVYGGTLTFGQPGIGDGQRCPLFAGGYNNFYSAGFNADFNGQAGTFMCWAKVLNIGVWADAAWRNIVSVFSDANNEFYFAKSAVANRLSYYYIANAIPESRAHNGETSINWMHLAMTWSKAAEQVIYYFNGIAMETDIALGAWGGAIAANRAVLGAQTIALVQPWSGWLAHAAIWNTPLTGNQILLLSQVTPF